MTSAQNAALWQKNRWLLARCVWIQGINLSNPRQGHVCPWMIPALNSLVILRPTSLPQMIMFCRRNGKATRKCSVTWTQTTTATSTLRRSRLGGWNRTARKVPCTQWRIFGGWTQTTMVKWANGSGWTLWEAKWQTSNTVKILKSGNQPWLWKTWYKWPFSLGQKKSGPHTALFRTWRFASRVTH